MRGVLQARPVRHPGPATRRAHVAPAVQVGVVAVVALVARLAPVLRGGGLRGILAYDDGVYYAASDALTFGRLPYRDLLLLHPPGITLVLAPFALLGRLVGDPTGLAAARLAFMAVGATSAVLVWVVARRLSPRAGMLAGLTYAVWQPATYAERTTLLEPLVNLGLLASLALLPPGASRRRTVAAGAALGVAVAVKAWAVVPFVVLAVWLLRRDGLRRAVTYAGSGAVAAAAVCLPFFVAAPGPMLRMVVLDQLGRPNNGVTTPMRLASIEAVHLSPAPLAPGVAATAEVTAVVVLGLTALLAWRRPATRVWAVLLAVQGGLLLTSPSYFGHYGTYVAPALALLAGAGADAVIGWAELRFPVVAAAGTALALVALTGLAVHVVDQPEGRRVPRQTVTDALAGVRCVAADSAAGLATADVLSRDLEHGCAVVADVTGLTYDQDKGDLPSGPTPQARRRDPQWQRAVGRYFGQAGAVLLVQTRADGLAAGLTARLERRFLELGHPSYRVLVPPG